MDKEESLQVSISPAATVGLPIPFKSEERLEDAVSPLVDAARTELWRNTLNILYINGSVLEFDHDIPVPVVVGMRGTDEGVGHFIELMESKFNVDVSRIVGSLAVKMLPNIIGAVIQEVGNMENPDEKVVIGAIAMKFMGSLNSMQTTMQGQIGAALQGAVSLAEGVGAIVFESLVDKRTNILNNVLDPDGYEEMLNGLQRLNLIHSRLEVSLCGECGNYSVALSNTPQRVPECPKCGCEWATLTLLVFDRSYAPLKVANQDLPLFISAYVRSETVRKQPIAQPRVFPLAQFHGKDGATLEIDVFVPDLNLGIECKEFEDALAPITRPRIASMAGGIAPQVKGYLSLGLRHVIVVTNLSEKGCSALSESLHSQLAKDLLGATVHVIPGTPEHLLDALDEVVEELSKLATEQLGKMVEGLAQKPH